MLIRIIPVIRKFIPARIPAIHRAVDGSPIIIIKPSKNCITAIGMSAHQKYRVFLFWIAKAQVDILSKMKYTPIALVIMTRLNIGAVNKKNPSPIRINPRTIFNIKCLV